MTVKDYFKIESDKLIRLKRNCPRCGPGTYMAEHSDRFSCGKCGWTVFKKQDKAEK